MILCQCVTTGIFLCEHSMNESLTSAHHVRVQVLIWAGNVIDDCHTMAIMERGHDGSVKERQAAWDIDSSHGRPRWRRVHARAIQACMYDMHISSVDSQKGAITIQRCSTENQKGAITIQRCSVGNQKGTVAIDFAFSSKIEMWEYRGEVVRTLDS